MNTSYNDTRNSSHRSLDLNYRVDIPDAMLRRILHDDEWDNGPKVEALTQFDQVGAYVNLC